MYEGMYNIYTHTYMHTYIHTYIHTYAKLDLKKRKVICHFFKIDESFRQSDS